MPDRVPVAIVGAGIAGLTLALCLARRGIRSLILERASYLEEVGAGLQLSPNASRILLDLGLGPALDAVAVRPEALVVRDAAAGGREVVRLPLGRSVETAHGAPYLVVHRGDLQAILLRAIREHGEIALELGVALEAVTARADAVAVEAVLGARRTLIEADALVGADGVWSAVRGRVLGGRPAVYSGRTAWRATVPVGELPAGLLPGLDRTSGLWLGPRAHLVHYPIRAGREVNLVAAVDEDWMDERWDVAGDPADLRRVFADWPEPARRLLALPRSWRKWALCAAPDGTAWTAGRVALAGDAVHGMLPFVAQGGAMAIEDAAVLARHLAAGGASVPDRLAAYAAERRPRVRRVVATARRNATVYHLGGLAARARNLALRGLGPAGLAARMDWIWGWRDEA